LVPELGGIEPFHSTFVGIWLKTSRAESFHKREYTSNMLKFMTKKNNRTRVLLSIHESTQPYLLLSSREVSPAPAPIFNWNGRRQPKVSRRPLSPAPSLFPQALLEMCRTTWGRGGGRRGEEGDLSTPTFSRAAVLPHPID
jgi:hypothetical protein